MLDSDKQEDSSSSSSSDSDSDTDTGSPIITKKQLEQTVKAAIAKCVKELKKEKEAKKNRKERKTKSKRTAEEPQKNQKPAHQPPTPDCPATRVDSTSRTATPHTIPSDEAKPTCTTSGTALAVAAKSKHPDPSGTRATIAQFSHENTRTRRPASPAASPTRTGTSTAALAATPTRSWEEE